MKPYKWTSGSSHGLCIVHELHLCFADDKRVRYMHLVNGNSKQPVPSERDHVIIL